MFKIKNLKYKEILDIEDLKIDQGKVTCIVGKSGSGKSSLLKLLNKINSPDSGTIYYKNQDIEEIDSIKYRRTIPMLAQFPVIYDGNIRDNLLMGLKFSGKNHKDDDALREALRKVQLEKDLEDDPSDLSGGEKQRLCIARIMLMDTDVILLDEPSSSLDSKTEYKIIKLIYEHIKANNKTMIYVTHSNEVANNFADTLIRMDSGKVVEVVDRGGKNE
jgi:putative ABC transport system ATP-binding protein